ncbi:MAG: hypothetical protein ACXAD7_22640, partial [Candidatus Kariarchaeaceae archaeon]
MVFAGESKSDHIVELLEHINLEYRVLIEFEGKTIITHILEQYRDADIISHYFIVGIPKELVTIPDGIEDTQI